MSVFIGVPAGRGVMSYQTVMTIVDLGRVLAARNIEYTVSCISFAEVARARNILAAQFLASERDIFIGIDDDVGINLDLIVKLFDYDADFLAVYLPQRSLNIEAFEQAVIAGKRGKNAQFSAAPFIGVGSNPKDPAYGTIDKVERIGTGFYILKRRVLETIIEHEIAPRSKFNSINFKQSQYGFFNNVPDADGDVLSEDFSFCERVRQAGFDIYAYLGPGISHTGSMEFQS